MFKFERTEFDRDDEKLVKTVKLTVKRNLKDYPFTAAMTKE